MEKFSDYIYEQRVIRRLTLREVATSLEMSAMYLSNLENGKKLPAKEDVVYKIANYYRCDPENLLTLFRAEKQEITKKEFNEACSKGEYQKAFAAARKNSDLSKVLSELLKEGGNI